MQRIFSTFPNGRPGAGLLLLRLVAGTPLLVAAISTWVGIPDAAALVLRLIGAVSAGLILLGLWTPLAAALGAMVEGWLSFAGGTFDIDHAMHALIALSLIMLGPGMWSVDARLYGRKRIEVGR
jgi:putative oxidoreductase